MTKDFPEAAAGGVIKNFTKFTGTHLCYSLFFNKVSGLRPAIFLQNTSGRLLLIFTKRIWDISVIQTANNLIDTLVNSFILDLRTWRYINADLKICQYLPLNMKVICWRFHIKGTFTFWDMRPWVMWKVCLQTFRNNIVC